MKKISLIVTSLVFCIAAVFIFPAKEANANPLAVGGALYLGGAGIYVVGALGVSAVAGLVELDSCPSCQQDIENHAKNVWANATQTAKDGLQLMVDGAIGAGTALTATDAAFNSWVDLQLGNMSTSVLNSKYGNITTYNSSLVCDCSRTGRKWVNRGAQSLAFMSIGKQYGEFYINSEGYGLTVNLHYDLANSTQNLGLAFIATDHPKYNEWHNRIQGVTNPTTLLELGKEIAGSVGKSFAFANIANYTADYASVNAKVTETWEEMTDAGLVLPVDNARPMAGDVPLTYNPTTDTYAGIDGITVPHEDVTGFEYQKPHWKTLDDLAALGLAGLGAGLYIDGWPSAETTTSTYDPATDLTTTVTSTGTTTNVTTGETAITGTTTTTTTGDTTGNPPVNPPPTTAPKPGDPVNPFKGVVPGASIFSLFQLLVAIIWYLIRMFTFVATIAFIAPTPIDNPYFMWFTTAEFYGITPFPLVQNLALFFLGFSIYKSIRRVF